MPNWIWSGPGAELLENFASACELRSVVSVSKSGCGVGEGGGGGGRFLGGKKPWMSSSRRRSGVLALGKLGVFGSSFPKASFLAIHMSFAEPWARKISHDLRLAERMACR